MIRIICIICATLLSQNILAQNIDQNRSTGERLPTAQYTPGGVAIIALDADKLPTATFNDIPVAVLKPHRDIRPWLAFHCPPNLAGTNLKSATRTVACRLMSSR